jgi:hypothetical protein
MKVRFSRHPGATTQPTKTPRRVRHSMMSKALERDRTTRLYSLLLPPSYPSERR